MADDFRSGICNGSWWNTARSGGFDAAAMPMTTAPPISCSVSGGSEEAFNWAAATAEPVGSASGSSVTYQDNNPMMASSMDWNQALLNIGRAETSFHTMLHQDLSSTNPFFRPQDTSIDLSMNPFRDMNQSLTNQLHLSSDVAPPLRLAPASSENYQPAIMGYQGIPTELSQPSSSWPGFTQFIDASPPLMQQSRNQSQFSGSSPFWNSLGSARSMDGSGFYPLMSTQFAPQSMEQKPSSSSNFNMKSSSKGARDTSTSSTAKKNNVSEPAMKKPRMEMPSPLPTFKVRKEKLGDRVTALQQLVSPFGKTDTASVLHETIDYIKFLHDQVKALSAPYLKTGHPMQHQQVNPNESSNEEGPKQDLKSRGLCLVPVASTYPVASEIPADFWTPPFGGLFR